MISFRNVAVVIGVAGVLLLGQGHVRSYSPAPDAALQVTSASPVKLGRGCTSAYYIDEDCDGYGPGVRSSGSYGIATYDYVGVGDRPDADDTDATLNTPASVLSRYDANGNSTLDTSELKTFLAQRRGYNVGDVFYVSPTGNNSTAAPNNPNLPYASYGNALSGVHSLIGPGDVMIFKAGTYPEPGIGGGAPVMKSGTATQPIIFMSMPGEVVAMTTTSSNTFTTSGAGSPGAAWVIIDGFTVEHPNKSAWGLGNGWSCSGAQNVIIRNIETARFSYVSCVDGHDNLTVERSIFHHQREHGFYMGANYNESSNITVQDNIFYANGWDPDDGDMGGGYGGYQFNGRCTGCMWQRNISHSNGAWGLSIIQGVHNSTLRNNLIFNNATYGIIMQIYDGSCPQLGTGDSGTCPYDTNNNLFVNNTIWVGTTRSDGVRTGLYPEPFAGIGIARNTTGCIEGGVKAPSVNCTMEQTFRNNVIYTANGPAWRFDQSAAIGDKWMEQSVFENNVVYKTGNATIATKESTSYTFADFSSTFGATNRNADPLFARANPADYAAPQLFDFRLQSGSPARTFGTSTSAPADDITRSTRTMPPDAGAYQGAPSSNTQQPPPPPTNLRLLSPEPATGTAGGIVWEKVQTQATGGQFPHWTSYMKPIYDPVSQTTLWYNARTTIIYSTDMFSYKAATRTWTRLGGTGASSCSDGSASTDLNGNAVLPWPSDRHPIEQLTIDTTRRRLYLAGGVCANITPNDTWFYALNADPVANRWTKVSTPTIPSVQISGSMEYSATDDVIVLHGTNSGSFPRTWVFCPGAAGAGVTSAQAAAGCGAVNNWHETYAPSTVDPPQSYFASLVHLPGTRTMLHFGHGAPKGEVWAYDVPTRKWVNRNPAGQPAENENGAPERLVTYLSSGAFKGKVFYHQTSHSSSVSMAADWLYDPQANTWASLVATGTGPQKLTYLVFDPSLGANGTIIAFSYDGGVWHGTFQ